MPGADPVPAVHLVVVSYRTPALLDRCLRSARADHDAGLLRVTVVDNAPGDGSAELVRNAHPWVELREPEANLGFGAAVDLGAAGTDAAWIVPANADVALRPGAIAALLRAGARDPGAGILAPRLLAPDGGTQQSVHPVPDLCFALGFNLGLIERSPRLARRFVLHGAWDSERGRRVPWAHGALLLVRGSVWRALGGFDPTMWMYAEDLDLCWRASRAGYAVRYVPEARVDHAVAAAAGPSFGETRERRGMTATYRWLARRRGPAIAAGVAGANVAGSLARVVLSDRDGRPLQRHWLRAHLGGVADALRPGRGPSGDRFAS